MQLHYKWVHELICAVIETTVGSHGPEFPAMYYFLVYGAFH